MLVYPEPLTQAQIKAILAKHLIPRFPNLVQYATHTMENNSYSYTATSTTYLVDYSLSPHANGATHSSFLIISRPIDDATAANKVYPSNSLAVIHQLIDKIRAGTEIPLSEFKLDTAHDIIPHDYLLTPPAPLISSQMISLSKARKLNLLSQRELMLTELQLGKFLGQLHKGVQNDWFGLPTLNNAEPAEPSYSWQETFTNFLEHLLSEVSTMQIYEDLNLKSKLKDIRKCLSRAIGSFLFEDVEVPSLVWFTGSEDDILLALPSRPHTPLPPLFSNPIPSLPSSSSTASSSAPLPSSVPHHPAPHYPASYRPSSPPAVLQALNANPPPLPPSLQNLTMALNLGLSPPSSPPPSYASSLTSQHISTLTPMSPSPTLPTSLTITTHTSLTGDANYAQSHHHFSTSKSIVTSPMIAAILPNVFHAIWGDPLLESFFLPQPTSPLISSSSSSQSQGQGVQSLAHTTEPAPAQPSTTSPSTPGRSQSLSTITSLPLSLPPSSAFAATFMPSGVTAPPPPSAFNTQSSLDGSSQPPPSPPATTSTTGTSTPFDASINQNLYSASPPYQQQQQPHQLSEPETEHDRETQGQKEKDEGPPTGGKRNPSKALMEGYVGGGGGNILVFPRQRTKRVWYTLFLAL
ncbi:hypothetical protein AX16_010396, partial [Volvariella volvacea WC 439]